MPEKLFSYTAISDIISTFHNFSFWHKISFYMICLLKKKNPPNKKQQRSMQYFDKYNLNKC